MVSISRSMPRLWAQPAAFPGRSCQQPPIPAARHAACASCCADGVPLLVSAHNIRPPAPRARTAAASSSALGTVMTAPPQACSKGRGQRGRRGDAMGMNASASQHAANRGGRGKGSRRIPAHQRMLPAASPPAALARPSALCCTAARNSSRPRAPPAEEQAGAGLGTGGVPCKARLPLRRAPPASNQA